MRMALAIGRAFEDELGLSDNGDELTVGRGNLGLPVQRAAADVQGQAFAYGGRYPVLGFLLAPWGGVTQAGPETGRSRWRSPGRPRRPAATPARLART